MIRMYHIKKEIGASAFLRSAKLFMAFVLLFATISRPVIAFSEAEGTTGMPESAPGNPLDTRSRQRSSVFAGEPLALPMSNLVICIDPGHQMHADSSHEPVSPRTKETKPKVAPGTQGVASYVPEYVTNLCIALQLRDALQTLGAEVVMTRDENDVNVSNIERAQIGNSANSNVSLRLHCNGSSDRSIHGIGLYVTATGAIAEESHAIAEVLIDAMTEETGARRAGVFRRDTYSGLNWSEVPAILVEMGYMTNPEEDLALQDPAYQQKLVQGMVRGIAEYFGCDIIEEQKTPLPDEAEETEEAIIWEDAF